MVSPRSIGGGNTQLVGLRRRRRRPLHQGSRRGRRDLPRAGDERLRLEYAMDRTYGALDPDGTCGSSSCSGCGIRRRSRRPESTASEERGNSDRHLGRNLFS